jgi:hypothetical protein
VAIDLMLFAGDLASDPDFWSPCPACAMNAKQFFDLLLIRTWWTYGSGNPDWFEIPYHFFNLLEGTIWMILSGLVLARYIRYRHSAIEVVYSAAFFTFGLTDFREAYALQSWLIWLKLANLLLLVKLRSTVIRRYYSTNKLY